MSIFATGSLFITFLLVKIFQAGRMCCWSFILSIVAGNVWEQTIAWLFSVYWFHPGAILKHGLYDFIALTKYLVLTKSVLQLYFLVFILSFRFNLSRLVFYHNFWELLIKWVILLSYSKFFKKERTTPTEVKRRPWFSLLCSLINFYHKFAEV